MPTGKHIDVDAVRELAARGLNSVQIAEEMGVSRQSINVASKRNGIALAPAPRGWAARNGHDRKPVAVKPRVWRASKANGRGKAPKAAEPTVPLLGNAHGNGESSVDYRAVLADLEARKASLQAVIDAIQNAL